jgi:hypothetical protein
MLIRSLFFKIIVCLTRYFQKNEAICVATFIPNAILQPLPEQLWLRWWDLEGNLLLVGKEEADLQRQRAEQERQRAEQAERKAAQLAARLRAMGIDPDAE